MPSTSPGCPAGQLVLQPSPTVPFPLSTLGPPGRYRSNISSPLLFGSAGVAGTAFHTSGHSCPTLSRKNSVYRHGPHSQRRRIQCGGTCRPYGRRRQCGPRAPAQMRGAASGGPPAPQGQLPPTRERRGRPTERHRPPRGPGRSRWRTPPCPDPAPPPRRGGEDRPARPTGPLPPSCRHPWQPCPARRRRRRRQRTHHTLRGIQLHLRQ